MINRKNKYHMSKSFLKLKIKLKKNQYIIEYILLFFYYFIECHIEYEKICIHCVQNNEIDFLNLNTLLNIKII